MCQEFIGLLVPLCTDNEVFKAMVGGQSRCDGWTVRYETVVGYFELEHLLRERERKGEVLGSVRYAPQLPISVPSSAARDVSWEEGKGWPR